MSLRRPERLEDVRRCADLAQDRRWVRTLRVLTEGRPLCRRACRLTSQRKCKRKRITRNVWSSAIMFKCQSVSQELTVPVHKVGVGLAAKLTSLDPTSAPPRPAASLLEVYHAASLASTCPPTLLGFVLDACVAFLADHSANDVKDGKVPPRMRVASHQRSFREHRYWPTNMPPSRTSWPAITMRRLREDWAS